VRPPAYDGPTRDEILALRREYLNPGLITYYDEPLCIVAGHRQYLFDETGRQYLDAAGGIVTVSVGHCHPEVTARLREQLGRLVHTTTLYLHPTVALYARALARRMPTDSHLTQTYFGNSGSEANDYAVLMAREFTGHNEVLALRNGYHGGTGATMRLTAISDWKFSAAAGLSVHHCPPGYCYRCPFGLTYPACDLKCAHSVADVIQHDTSREIACFIAEPIQGVGGVIAPPPEYFRVVYDVVRRYGGVCIADEVQTAWGRTGDHFWGFENYGVTPDVVTLAKGIGNGTPLSAVTARPEIARALAKRLHFNTFGGNPVSATAGLAVLDVIAAEGLQENARVVGGYLKGQLTELQEKHALIGEVRGNGLLLGVELVADRRTREPATAPTRRVVELARQRGLLVAKSGSSWNTIRLAPPLCVTRADCDFLVACLDACLADVAAGR